MVSSLGTGAVEVKSDRYRNGRMVVETHQRKGAMTEPSLEDSPWKLSGINVTTAEWWVYVFSMDGSFLVISTARLKKFLKTHRGLFNESSKRIFAASSDNPAKGWILEPTQVIDLLVNPAYD